MGVIRCLPSVMALGLLSTVIRAQSAQPITVFTEAQATAGKAVYEIVGVNCHTDRLTGRRGEPDEIPALASLAEPFRTGVQQANGKIPPVAGEVFIKRWSSRTIGALSTASVSRLMGFH